VRLNKNTNQKITVMIRIFITFMVLAWFATSDVFAQRGRQPVLPSQATTSFAVVEENGVPIIRLPQQNDPAGITAGQTFDAAQRLINPPIPPFGFMQPTDEERIEWFQQAVDTLQTLLVFVNPPNEVEVVMLSEDLPQTPFVPDAFVNAHYLLGMGWAYFNMMNHPDLFNPTEAAEFPRKAAGYFEAFIQNGVGENSIFVYDLLANLYLLQLNDSRRAMINIDRCIALDPRSPHHHIVRAQILQREGYLEAACEALKQARQLGETEATRDMMQSWSCP